MICPYCRNEIKDGALKCQFCQSLIPQPPLPSAPIAAPAVSASVSKFDLAIIQYTNQDWLVTGRSPELVTLKKPKPVNWGVIAAIVLAALLFTPFTFGFSLLIGAGIYFLFFYGKYDKLTLKLDADGEVRPSQPFTIPVSEPDQPAQKHDESTPRRTIIIVIVVFVAATLCILAGFLAAKGIIEELRTWTQHLFGLGLLPLFA